MDTLNRASLNKLIAEQSGLCVSIYSKTQPGGDEQSIIRTRHQVDEAEKQLRERGVRTNDATEWLEPVRKLQKSSEFWQHASHGLAVFASEAGCQVFRLPLLFDNEVYTGPHFQIRPLLPWFADEGRFYILAISQNHVRLLEGTSHGVRLIPLTQSPASMADAQRTHDRDEVLNYHTHPGAMGTSMQAVFHGHGVGIDDHKTELGQYLHKIDRAICQTIGESRAPLILATVDYLAAIYAAHSHYSNLLKEVLTGNPDHLSPNDLHAKALPFVKPILHRHEARLLEQYPRLKAAGRTSEALNEVLPAAYRGELETLLLSADRQVWGVFDPATQRVEEHAKPGKDDVELTNLAAIHVLRHHHAVHVVRDMAPFGAAPLAGVFFHAAARAQVATS